MKIEHFAWDMPDPVAAADWYCKHLGFRIVRHNPKGAQMTFLADDSGTVCIEIYRNPKVTTPDYPAMHPLLMHLALVSEDPEADRSRLEAAGATFFEEDKLADGSHLIMMKDPWGVSLQLCKRGNPFI
ncbi:MAG: VOC family protein [Puniceicoccaceae bacterium]